MLLSNHIQTIFSSLQKYPHILSNRQPRFCLIAFGIKSYRHYKKRWIACNVDNLIHARYENCSFWKCDVKPSDNARKIFFNHSKLCVISYFTKKVHFLPPKHASRFFSNEFSQHCRQESFDCDSVFSQSRLCFHYPMLSPVLSPYNLGKSKGQFHNVPHGF